MKQLRLIAFFICLLIIGLVVGANAQKRVILQATMAEDGRDLISVVYAEGKDTLGFDYLTKKEFNKEFKEQYTGEVFTDYKGDRYPILLSVNQKKFIVRKSRNGKWYRYYMTSKLS